MRQREGLAVMRYEQGTIEETTVAVCDTTVPLLMLKDVLLPAPLPPVVLKNRAPTAVT